MTVEGGFDGEVWRLSGAADAESLEWRFASIHEHYHAQLQNTSAWGALCRLLLDQDSTLGAGFVAACEAVQEAFATWMAATIVGDAPLGSRPSYQRHHRAMSRLVDDVPNLYLASHAALAIASVSMQPVALAAAPSTLDSVRLADFRRSELPDRRFAKLRTVPPRFEAAVSATTALVEGSNHPAARQANRLTAEMFDGSWRGLWEEIHHVFYDAVATSLARQGSESLSVEGHAAVAERLIAAAGSRRLVMAKPLDPREAAMRTLGDVERESFTLDLERPLREIPTSVDAVHMVAAHDPDTHLFLRFQWRASAAQSDRPWSVVLRRTGRVADTNFVQQRPVAESETLKLGSSGLECLSLVPASLLGRVNESSWAAFATTARSALLLDLSIADSIMAWTSGGHRLDGTILQAESMGASVPVLLCRIFDRDEPASHVMIRALSPHAANAMLVTAKELVGEGVAFRLDAPLEQLMYPEEHRRTMLIVAHYVGEESTFGGVQDLSRQAM